MVKEIMHVPGFLSQKSEMATKEDLQIAQDLLNTLTPKSLKKATLSKHKKVAFFCRGIQEKQSIIKT